MITFNVIAERQDEFAFRLSKLRDLVRQGLIDPELGTLPKQAQLLTERCIKMTPPKTQEQGENKVARDIYTIIRGRTDGYLDFVTRVTGTTTNVRQALTTKKGVPYLIDVDVIDQDGSQIAAWHAKHRDKRRGRVWGGNTGNKESVIGRWRARNRLWAPAEMVEKYTRTMQSHVGTAKAGWLRAYIALRGKRAPDWVKRQSQRQGIFVDGMASEKPFIEVRNASRWGRLNNNSQDIVQRAIAARARDMGTYFNKMMELAAKGTATPWQVAQAAQFTEVV